MAVTSIKPNIKSIQRRFQLSSALVIHDNINNANIVKCAWAAFLFLSLFTSLSLSLSFSLSIARSVARATHTFPFCSLQCDTTAKFNVIYVIDIRPDTFSFSQSIFYPLSLIDVRHLNAFYVFDVAVSASLPAIFFRCSNLNAI